MPEDTKLNTVAIQMSLSHFITAKFKNLGNFRKDYCGMKFKSFEFMKELMKVDVKEYGIKMVDNRGRYSRINGRNNRNKSEVQAKL